MKTEKQTKPAGGALIVLSMQGFGERWHPGEKQERLCAAGRMLYLSPYEPQGAKLDKREMHIRAHALVDWALGHSHDHLEAWPWARAMFGNLPAIRV